MGHFWADQPDLVQPLNQVRQLLLDLIQQAPKNLRASLEAWAPAEGKGLRPALVIIGALDSGLTPKILEMAAALELLHTASLIHDDVLDGALFRRSKPTMNQTLGTQQAVLYGDLLFTACFHLITGSVSPENARNISRIMSLMVLAEIQQNQDLFQLPQSLRSCLKKTMGKTAALFALALHLGAVESGLPPEHSSLLRRLGYHLGMAFQLQDDLMDFFPHSNKPGKPAFWDLCHGIYTLPVFFALKNNPDLGPKILASRTPSEASHLLPDLEQSQGFSKTRYLVDQHFSQAFSLLDAFPQGKTRHNLDIFLKKLTKRDY